MELCGGNLRNFLAEKEPSKEEKLNLTRSWAKQICLGLQFLHENGVVHSKLKLSDLVLNDEIVKITGIAIALQKFNEDNVKNSNSKKNSWVQICHMLLLK
jgi:serine/threonine protein kinase